MTDSNRTTLLDAKISDAREDLAKATAKLERLLVEQANRSRIEGLAVGASVSFEYGRGEKRRVLTGNIVAQGDDEKQGRMFAVQVGEGVDIETIKIRASDVMFNEAEQGEAE